MLKMKYLLALVLVALCVSLASGMAFAQDSWAIALDDEDEPLVDLPSGLGWGATYNASVSALNDGSTTWTKAAGYQLLSVEGTTGTGLTLIDRWGLTAVNLTNDDVIAPDDVKDFAFGVAAPPISGTFDCNWIMGVGGNPITTALAASSVMITRYPDTTAGTAGEWASAQIEGCAGRLPFIVQGYADGLYRPALKVTRDQMAVFIRRAMGIPQLTPEEPTFTDVDDTNWAFGDIEALADAEVITGFGDGTYQPAWDVYRSQMAKFIALGANVPQPTDEELDAMMDPEDPAYDPAYFAFPDVPYLYWADNFIYALRDAGIVLGYPDGLYRPGANIDRGQLAVYCYRAFIGTTTEAVVLGGPGVTDVDLTTTPSYHGWSKAQVDPDWAYVEFDAAAIGPELAGAGTWDILFEFADVTTPTTIEDTAAVSLDAADLTGVTGTYFTVAAKIPVMITGEKIMYTTVEAKDGTPVKLTRTVTFEQSEPPPPPGAPRTPNALGGTTWLDFAGGWGDGYSIYDSGTYSNMKYSDDAYYVMKISAMPLHDAGWADCCQDPGYGLSLKWTGFEIPVGATEMKLVLEYHVYDPEDGTGQNNMNCADLGWCYDGDIAGDGIKPNMCRAWSEPGPWIDATHPNYGWGLVMMNYADPWDWTGAEIQDTPAEGGIGGAFAYNPTADLAMEWTTNDWTNFVHVGDDGNEAVIHWCGGSIYKLMIDQCTLEFNPH